MADVVDKATRSRMMAGIRGKNTRPEIFLRKGLHALGFRFRLHRKDLPGRPDIVLPRHRAVIFINGCFWHAHDGCRNFRIPATRPEFWTAKLMENRARDQVAQKKLNDGGWRVLTVWECATRSISADTLSEKIARWLQGNDTSGEIAGPLTVP
jgi:DNA mismatch endonuclease (patch repair protein)